MIGIAFLIILGFLADKFGRKFTIMLGLSLFALFMLFSFYGGNSFRFYIGSYSLSGVAVGVFTDRPAN